MRKKVTIEADNIQIHNHEEEEERLIREVMEGEKNPYALTHMKGIYFDEETARMLEALKKEKGRGAISKFVNAAVRKELKRIGK